MNTAAESDTYSLELTHTFSAPRDEVFAAWTEGDQLMQWFGSEGSKTTNAKVDLRVGGGYRMEMTLADGQKIAVRGAFREVSVPEKLVYTWEVDAHDMGDIRNSLVTVVFEERGEWTDLRLRHEALPDQPACERHEQGWKGCFESLTKHMKKD